MSVLCSADEKYIYLSTLSSLPGGGGGGGPDYQINCELNIWKKVLTWCWHTDAPMSYNNITLSLSGKQGILQSRNGPKYQN